MDHYLKVCGLQMEEDISSDDKRKALWEYVEKLNNFSISELNKEHRDQCRHLNKDVDKPESLIYLFRNAKLDNIPFNYRDCVCLQDALNWNSTDLRKLESYYNSDSEFREDIRRNHSNNAKGDLLQFLGVNLAKIEEITDLTVNMKQQESDGQLSTTTNFVSRAELDTLMNVQWNKETTFNIQIIDLQDDMDSLQEHVKRDIEKVENSLESLREDFTWDIKNVECNPLYH